jgi:hypothetical protein
MNKFKYPACALLFAAATILGACSHHRAVVDNSSGVASGEIRPADTNATQPAGPAVVDSTGRVYTSSNAPGSGNAAMAGTNTNVSVAPKSSTSTVSVTETPVATTSELSTSTTTVTETPVVTTPAPEPTPMTSSTQETTTSTTTTTHRRMHKD